MECGGCGCDMCTNILLSSCSDSLAQLNAIAEQQVKELTALKVGIPTCLYTCINTTITYNDFSVVQPT